MTIKEIGEKKAELVVKMREMNELVAVEKRAFKPEEQQTWDEMNSDYEKLEQKEKDAIKAEERAASIAKREQELNASRGRKAQPDPLPGGNPGGEQRSEQTEKEKRLAEYRSTHVKWLRGELSNSEFASACERRDLQADVPQIGGYITAPQEMMGGLLKFVDDLVFIRGVAKKFQLPTAESLGVPTLEADPADADWTSELGTGNRDTAMAFGKRALTPHPLAKRIKVSRTLLRKAVVGAENLVSERLAYKFAITEEKAFLTGSGAQQPLGVFTADNNGIPTSQDVSTDNTGTAITADGLINAKYNLKAQYQNSPSCAWGFSRTAVRNIRKLKDGAGQYLWSPGLGDTPSTILDTPYFMSEYVPSTFTTGLYVGIIGDWSFYWIVDALAMGLQRLDELYAETNQIGFIGRMEMDGMPVLAEAFTRVKLG